DQKMIAGGTGTPWPADGRCMSDVEALIGWSRVVKSGHRHGFTMYPGLVAREQHELKPVTVVLRRIPHTRTHIQRPLMTLRWLDAHEVIRGNATVDRAMTPLYGDFLASEPVLQMAV